VLQSAFGFAYFQQRFILYKPTNKALHAKQVETLFDEAMKALDTGVRGEGAKIPFCWRALAYKSLGQHSGYFSEGIANARKALALDPKDASSYLQLASAYAVRGEHYDPKLVELFSRKALEIRPKASSAYFNLAGVYFDKKQYGKALAMLQKDLNLMPQVCVMRLKRKTC
jgi:tetratricopeptide (TPR) repeat protein